ncbi:MAG TPA: L-histidine N(alpha)-methyltransferase [Chitinophagaceae bacterium]
MENFLNDVFKGLQSTPKYLQSKYFYDKKGDELFAKIMRCNDYYLTRCEYEIFKRHSGKLSAYFKTNLSGFDIVELGAGDATKSSCLLKALLDDGISFTYYPVDISKNIILDLESRLPKTLPGLKIKGLNGEYFDMLAKANELLDKTKIVLFLGSNIGNIPVSQTISFLTTIRQLLKPGDWLLIGFDLQKNPYTILNAYNDKGGLTKQFNLNLLQRINNELDGNFDLGQFDHYPVYDPSTGTCKSFLISLKDQRVTISKKIFGFCQNEFIHTEISQKYTIRQIDQLAKGSGFQAMHCFHDEKKWFVDALWKAC